MPVASGVGQKERLNLSQAQGSKGVSNLESFQMEKELQRLGNYVRIRSMVTAGSMLKGP